MPHSRTFAPFFGLTAFAAASLLSAALFSAALFSAAPARAQTVTVTDLTPPGYVQAQATSISGSAQAGYGQTSGNDIHAQVWNKTANSVVDLGDAGFDQTSAYGVSGDSQVGQGRFNNNDTINALLWHGTADSVINLQPAGFDDSLTSAVSGNSQVGRGYNVEAVGTSKYHALLWHGTPESVIDLNGSRFGTSYANGVSGDTQVGAGDDHAVLWHGTPASAVDLNPTGFVVSFANGASDTAQVGTGYTSYTSGNFIAHALLWHGTAKSAVDLNPFGYTLSAAYGTSGDVQVGTGSLTYNNIPRALLWRGTAASVVDLSKFLPTGFNELSQALGVSGNGNVYDVVGYGSGTSNQHAFLWHVVFDAPAKPALTDIEPASRTEGREAFALTVSGMDFTAKSVVMWNGAAQPTTFVSSAKLTAQIPASLIATAGTATILVFTSGAGGSHPRTETIMARPTLSSLSPTSKKAGSGAFTLTVTGTGFRPASFYAPSVVKWNGAELATTFVSATKLTVKVPASLLTQAERAVITVTTPQVATSSGIVFTVTP